MKRILSFVMVLAMMLSAAGAVTVSADDVELSIPADYPYVYFDFEDGTIPGAVGGTFGAYDSWVAGGAYGSKGCLTATVDSSNWPGSNYAEWQINLPTVDLEATYKFSFLTKIGTDSFGGVTPGFDSYLFGDSTYMGVNFVGTPVANQWVKYEATVNMAESAPATWTATSSYNLRLRFTGFHLMKAAQPAAEQATYAVQLSFDDIVIEPVRTHGAPAVPVFDDSFVTAVTSENNGNDDVNATFVASRAGLSLSTVNTPDATTAAHGSKVLKVTKTSAQNTYGDLMLANLKFNHRYKISADIKPVAASGTPKVDLFDVHVTGFPGVAITDTTAGASNYPSKSTTLTNNAWNTVEYYLTNEAVTFDNGPAFALMYRFPGNSVPQNTVFYMDNIIVQDLGLVTNGDFESTIAPSDLWRANSATAIGSHDVFSWYGIDATAATSADVRTAVEDAETTSTKSMQITVDTNGGIVYQPVDFTHKQAYTISFWAKNPNLADGADQSISIKLNRNDDTPDNTKDIFVYPNDAIETITVADNKKLTNQWQKFTATYTPNFALADGKTEADLQTYVAPRKPYLYFDVDGNLAGTSFLVDDIVIETQVASSGAYPYPYMENALATSDVIVGLDATFTYQFVSEIGKTERAAGSIARILASENGTAYACYGQKAVSGGTGAFSVPEDAAGKYFKVEILAIDADGTYGEVASIDFGQAFVDFDVNVTYPTWNVAGNQITASVTIENNLAENAGEELVVLLAVYSENNTLLYTTSQAVTLTGSYNNTITLSGIINGPESLTAHHVKTFVWGGTTVANAGDSIWKVAESYSPAA